MAPLKMAFIHAAAATAILASGAAWAQAASSAVLTLGGGWEPVEYFNPNPYPDPYGGPLYDAYTGDTDFTFTLTNHAELNITDLYYNLDRFDLTINGVDESETFYPLQGFAFTDDPDVAFADSHFSHASYGLGPGTYDVTGVATYSVAFYGGGIAAIELAAPEPAGWILMIFGFGAIGGIARRRIRSPGTTA